MPGFILHSDGEVFVLDEAPEQLGPAIPGFLSLGGGKAGANRELNTCDHVPDLERTQCSFTRQTSCSGGSFGASEFVGFGGIAIF